MDVREKIIAFVKIRGPVLPVQVSKEVKLDILMSSAYLSELVSNKKLKISYLKIGGSPLYYAQGHEASLQNFWFPHHLHFGLAPYHQRAASSQDFLSVSSRAKRENA